MPSRLEAIDWLRGFAALWVLCYHVNIVIQKDKYFAVPSMGLWAEVGHRGVDLFFVLSGFIMAATTRNGSRGVRHDARNFAIRRFMRIFPVYWLTLATLVVLGMATGLDALASTGENLVANVLLLPRDDLTTYVPVVAWTLTHELMFYAIFTTTFISRKLSISLLMLWAAVCLATAWFGIVPDGWQMPLSLLNLYFLVGVGAALLAPRVAKHPLAVGAAAGMLLIAAILLEPAGEVIKADFSLRTLCYMLGLAGLIMSFSRWRITQAKRWHQPLSALGRQSYSLYLLHYPIVIVFAIVLTRVGLPWWALLPLALAAALVASWLMYRVVERRGIAIGRRLTAEPAAAGTTARF